ncbi:MAG: hypothetical protein U1E27_11855 [Kiritimatiellia bacterium]|nr:hypothetical protein [Kiritimatiellia bacterium]
MKKIWILAGLFGLGGATGCLTDKPAVVSSRMIDPAELDRLFSAGRDPGEFFIHSHRDASGRSVFTGQNRMLPDSRAVLLFESAAHSALPIVRATAPSGTDLLLLTDTTSQQNWVNLDLKDRIGLIPIGPNRVGAIPAHVFDETPGYLSVLPSLDLDRMRVESILFYARMARQSLWPLHRHADARDIQAVLGLEFLRGFAYVTWDFSTRMMTFSATDPFQPDSRAVLAELPVSFNADLGAIEVPCILDGVETPVIFDSAGDYELALESPPMDLIRQIGFQDLVLRRVRAVTPQSVGLEPVETPYLGTRLLRRFRVTLDNRRNVLWIESPDSAVRGEPSDETP